MKANILQWSDTKNTHPFHIRCYALMCLYVSTLISNTYTEFIVDISINGICLGYSISPWLHWLTAVHIQQSTQWNVAHHTHKCATHIQTHIIGPAVIDIRNIDYSTADTHIQAYTSLDRLVSMYKCTHVEHTKHNYWLWVVIFMYDEQYVDSDESLTKNRWKHWI